MSPEEDGDERRKRALEAAEGRLRRSSNTSSSETEPQKDNQAKVSEQQFDWACAWCSMLNTPEQTNCVLCGAQQSKSTALRLPVAAAAPENDTRDEQPPQNKRPRIDERSDPSATTKWACSFCTLLNSPENSVCEVCENHRFATSLALPYPRTAPSDTGTRGAPSSPLPLPESFKIVSLNVSGFHPSVSAPGSWNPIPAFSEELLRDDPDVVCLQEATWNVDFELLLPGYIRLGSASSHCDEVMLFVRAAWAPHAQYLHVPGPAVVARISFVGMDVLFGSCHLAPFREGASERYDSMKKILKTLTEREPLIISGDYNVRKAENAKFQRLGLRDAWIEAGEAWEQENTWDSIDHRQNSGPYNKYHDDCNQFACRFDRIYFQGKELSMELFRLIANQPLTNPLHYLSDHFGMRAIIRVNRDEQN
jgi:endonuclease/exonuclease/phosphatase family metal-dependent hydrolase